MTVLEPTLNETMDRDEERRDSVATAPREQKVARVNEAHLRTDGRSDDGEVARNVSMTNTHTTGIVGRIGAWAQRKVRVRRMLIKA